MGGPLGPERACPHTPPPPPPPTAIPRCTDWLFRDELTGAYYINLHSNDNWSEWLPLRTTWQKVRLSEPPLQGSTTVQINLTDTKFASSNMSYTPPTVPYEPTSFVMWGFAGRCKQKGPIPDLSAYQSWYQLDLTGTPFRLEDDDSWHPHPHSHPHPHPHKAETR